MDKQEIRLLLLRIVNDADFRKSLIADPVYTLSQVGITLDPADVPAGGVKLPPNEEIEAALEQMTDAVAAGKSHINVLLSLGC